MERQKLLRAQDPGHTRTGSPRVNATRSDGLGRSLGLVELNVLGKSQETERNWLKNALQCELNQLKLGEVGIFCCGMGDVNSSCLVKFSCDVFFLFSRLF